MLVSVRMIVRGLDTVGEIAGTRQAGDSRVPGEVERV